MATHFSILAWRIPWTEEPGRLQSIGFHRVRHDWSDSMHACMCRAINTVQKDTLSPGSLVWISAVFTFQPFSFMYIQAFNLTGYSLVQSLSHVQLCDPMDCSMRGFPVHHQLPELAQTYVHWVSDAIQPSHSLSSLSLSAFSLSQWWVFSKESVLHIMWPKYLCFSISPSNEYSELIFFRVDCLNLLALLLQHHSVKH